MSGRKHTVILDGDFGGDEFQVLAVLLAHSEEVELLFATTNFGNRKQEQVFHNGRDFMSFLGAETIKVYPGAYSPLGGRLPVDDAHGEDGKGGARIPSSSAPLEMNQADDVILDALRSRDEKTVTILVGGPLTNIARAFIKDAEALSRVHCIIAMGGATIDMSAKDVTFRRGNITRFSEFNFFTDAIAAKIVMESGLPLTLIPLNATQDLSFTPERRVAIEQLYAARPDVRDAVIAMMTAPANLDRVKFDRDPFMHDIHIALFLLYPDLYKINSGRISVTVDHDFGEDTKWVDQRIGRTDFIQDDKSNLQVVIDTLDTKTLFFIYQRCLTARIPPDKTQPLHHVTTESIREELYMRMLSDLSSEQRSDVVSRVRERIVEEQAEALHENVEPLLDLLLQAVATLEPSEVKRLEEILQVFAKE